MEGNIAVQNWTVGSHTMGMTGNIKDGHDYDISYVENIVGGLNKDEAFRSGNPLIIGDAYTPGTQDSNFTLTVNGVTKKIGNVTDVVNIKNSSYKIDFDTAMAGVRQYASAMYGKSDTKGVTLKILMETQRRNLIMSKRFSANRILIILLISKQVI